MGQPHEILQLWQDHQLFLAHCIWCLWADKHYEVCYVYGVYTFILDRSRDYTNRFFGENFVFAHTECALKLVEQSLNC
jgi:hypothetical protein